MTEQTTTLKRTLGSFRLWGIAVSQAGTLGFMIVALAIAAMYCAFIFSFTELTTAIPHAGGPFAYAYRAFGPTGGFIAGFATLIEFVFAPPAIAMAIGAYLNVQFPALDPKWV
ncbi:MAG: amino acid permease, partial [Klebsiella michiganensis]|nr:amino acid permease [Klebsiella michiganensis]